jgi:hypothetical protein
MARHCVCCCGWLFDVVVDGDFDMVLEGSLCFDRSDDLVDVLIEI